MKTSLPFLVALGARKPSQPSMDDHTLEDSAPRAASSGAELAGSATRLTRVKDETTDDE